MCDKREEVKSFNKWLNKQNVSELEGYITSH
jgi:hypothetical protein